MLSVTSLEPPLLVGWRHGRLIQRFMRVRNAKLPIALFVAVAAVRDIGLGELALGSILLVLLYGFVVIFNDIHDAEADRLNRRELPIATGEVDVAQASRILVALAVVISCVVLAWGSAAAALATTVATTAGLAYSDPSLRISDRGFLGPTLLALCYVGTPVLFALALTDGSYRQVVPVTVVAVLLAFTTSLYKDYGDETGDASTGKLTPLVRYGSETVVRGAILVQGLAALLGSLWLGPSWWLWPVLTGIGLALLIDSPWRSTVIVTHRYLTTASICLLAAGSLG
ncbi:MAG: UbiA family prenyltransferase [Acidimicrobiia bacterium]|nr:UbiA family prenyltransferase [Acidimicrobiia bacterium]